ncbi:MMS19 nucleotide excision repair protein homolog [Anabrus simplex]|uniref:MMS19 nucleotide excision repair protein homolog n=1 Tax=Anabrus simplex TaxID=316456 RepID=UPI0035A2D803
MEAPWLNDNLSDAIKEDEKLMDKGHDIASDIAGNKLKLLTLVERLGGVLTDTDAAVRARGTHVLSQVLQHLPTDSLSQMECSYLSTFFCDRLKDYHVVTPSALQGVLALAKMENAPKDMAVNILTVMFQHVSCQSLKPENRRCVFQIFQLFIHKYTEELKMLGPDFVFGFMTAIDGERDAQNLLIVFRMLPFFLKTFPLGHLLEDMFETMACYFPVDYRAENQKNAVSRESLAEALAPCLTAIPDFAQYCIPLLVEKLDSKLKLAKLDSFHLVVAGCDVFTIRSIKPYVLELWRAIQQEVLPGSDREVRTAGLAALKAMVHMASVTAVDKEESKFLTTLVTYVISAGLDSLKEVELNLFEPAVQMFLTVSEASPAACQEILKQVIPVLIQQYYKESGAEQQVTVLRALTNFLAVCQHHNFTLSGEPEVFEIWKDVPSLYLTAAQLANPEIRREAFYGLTVAAKSLEPRYREQLYALLCKQVKQQDQDSIRREVLACLKELSRVYPEEVMTTIVQAGLNTGLESEPLNGTNGLEMFLCMDALCEIASREPFTSYVLPHILKCITESYQLDKCLIGVKCLRKLVESAGTDVSILNYLYLKCNTVSRLLLWWTEGVRQGALPLLFGHVELMQHTAKIINVILRVQSTESQTAVVVEHVPLFINSDSQDCKINPLNPSSPWEHTQLVVLLEALLGSVRREVKILSFRQLVVMLAQVTMLTSHDITKKSAGRLVSNLINKAECGEELSRLLCEVSDLVKASISCDTSRQQKLNATHLCVWVTKALVMRGYEQMDLWVDYLLELLAHEVVGMEAAAGFKLIMEQNEEYLNPSSYCIIRILYKQRFFMVTPKLVSSFRSASQSVQVNYLVALAHLLQGVPKEVLLMDFQQMVPLLVESLDQSESLLLLTTLETLESILEEKHNALEDHLQTFIPRILNLAQFPDFMRVRIKALKCIYHFCKFPLEKILPFKTKVVQQLGKCLDDPKRLVRREAVRARSLWFIVGAPGGDGNT